MHRHVIYIINPVAGTGNKAAVQKLIEKKMQAAKIPFLVLPSVASGDYSYLTSFIKENKTTDVIIAGGDGTISQVVGSLCSLDINFGIIPCGSGNGVAFTTKIPARPEKALDLIIKGKSTYIDGFSINDHFACMLCGLGFDAKVAHDFARQPKRGLATYIRQVVKNFFFAKTYSFKLNVKNKTFATDAYFISIANSNQFGNNFRIAPRASMSDGLLDIVIVTNQTKLSMLFQTLKQVSGGNKLQTKDIIENKGVIYFQTASLSISNLSEAPLHIDGDPAETIDELKIEIKKKCFRLIQP
jgi:diacylglycerol kinase (ATP)